MKRTLAFVAVVLAGSNNCASGDFFGNGSNTFEIAFVNVGNPGNPADTTGNPNPAGSVAYTYGIGKYEISEQMIDKANALGALGITKTSRGPDKPATEVSWIEALQFVNWLNTSSGYSPAYKIDGGGNFQVWQPGDPGYNPANEYRSNLAQYFLPSVHEWYKAAFYDPVASTYYNYPTGSDNVPDGIDFAGDTSFEAVFFDGVVDNDPQTVDPQPNPAPNDVTDVGLLSPYGTAGQSGNVGEFEETDFDLVNDANISAYAVRGSVYNDNSVGSNSLFRGAVGAATSSGTGLGFRVASRAVPEPSSLLLLIVGMSAAFMRRHRSVRADRRA